MRKPQFAGSFYAKDPMDLTKQITECFEGERGPGAVPISVQKNKKDALPLAVIAPHAGYQFSGACAAWAYKAIGDAPLADLYIIIAPSHKAGKTATTLEPFETPLGIVRVDQEAARLLIENGSVPVDDEAFVAEHAIEVQLPLLQFAHTDAAEKLKILPLLISPDADLHQISLDLKEVMLHKKTVIIVSSDFTHYGRNYHFVPFSKDIQENIAKLDQGAIEKIKAFDHAGLVKYVEESMATICGVLPMSLMLRTIRPKKVNVEQYYTSTAVTGDEKNSVSYASIVFY